MKRSKGHRGSGSGSFLGVVRGRRNTQGQALGDGDSGSSGEFGLPPSQRAEAPTAAASVTVTTSASAQSLGSEADEQDEQDEQEEESFRVGQSEEAMAEDDARKLELVQRLMETSKSSTNKIIEVLEAVENRIAAVEAGLAPIHKVTSKLRTMHNNLGSSVSAMDSVFTYFLREADIHKTIMDGPGRDLESFLERLSQLDDAIEFFEKQKEYASSDDALKRLKSLHEIGIGACEKLYRELWEKGSVPIDPAQLPSPLPKEITLIDDGIRQRLLVLAEVLKTNPVLVRDYTEFRGRFFFGVLRKTPAIRRMQLRKGDAFTPLVARLLSGPIEPSASSGPTSSAAVTSSQSILINSGSSISMTAGGSSASLESEEDDLGKQFLEFTLLFLRVAEHERRLAVAVFGDDAFVPAFSSIFEEPFDLFVRLAEATIKTRPRFVPEVERVFYLIDLYDELSGRLKPLNQVARMQGRDFDDRISSILDLFRSSVKQALNAFLESVRRDSTKVGNDGNVHPLSSRTLNYMIKRLLPKRTCVEFLVHKWLDVEVVTLEVIILTTCNELLMNLEEKAKRIEKKQSILANVFLLNNYHYILNTVRNNNVLPPDLIPSFAASYDTKILQEIEKYRASWNQALEFLAETQSNKPQMTASEYKLIKAKFAGFNKALEKLFHTQKLYTVPNHLLRQDLRELAKSTIVPAYRSFLARYADIPFTKNRQKYEKYSVETLVNMLDKFFDDAAQ